LQNFIFDFPSRKNRKIYKEKNRIHFNKTIYYLQKEVKNEKEKSNQEKNDKEKD